MLYTQARNLILITHQTPQACCRRERRTHQPSQAPSSSRWGVWHHLLDAIALSFFFSYFSILGIRREQWWWDVGMAITVRHWLRKLDRWLGWHDFSWRTSQCSFLCFLLFLSTNKQSIESTFDSLRFGPWGTIRWPDLTNINWKLSNCPSDNCLVFCVVSLILPSRSRSVHIPPCGSCETQCFVRRKDNEHANVTTYYHLWINFCLLLRIGILGKKMLWFSSEGEL